MRDASPKLSMAGKSKAGGTATAAERRGGPRINFTATAEVIELTSGAHFAARTTDLGPGGCFVDTTLPFPVGAYVRLILQKGNSKLETGGSVVYSQTGLGMGIAFSELDRSQKRELDEWLGEMSGERTPTYVGTVTVKKAPAANAAGKSTLARTIQLLVRKGVITETEASILLDDNVL